MTETQSVNREALLELAKWLTQQEALRQAGKPSEWNQASWVETYNPETDELNVKVNGKASWCGTACCAAGHVAVHVRKAEPAFHVGYPTDSQGNTDYTAEAYAPWERVPDDMKADFREDPYAVDISDSWVWLPDEQRARRINDVGANHLGLTEGEACRLFAASNEYPDMMRIIAGLLDVSVAGLRAQIA